ncbi:hypothetical protein PENTCL1PPCAC_15705, partial [Pristionchus entomophagus]
FLLQLSQTIVWGSRISQMLTVLMIATNRVTAIRYALKHLSIWSNTTQSICAFFQATFMFVFGCAFVAYLRPIRVPSLSFGGVVTAYELETEQRNAVFLGATILQSTNALIFLFLYMLIFRGIRKEIDQVAQSQYNLAVVFL